MKQVLRRIRLYYRFLKGGVLGLVFYRDVLSHSDYKHYDSPGWLRINKCWFQQKIIGKNRRAIWPVTNLSLIGEPNNLVIDETSEVCLMTTGLYLQCMDAQTIIGANVYIAPNVGIINSNHDVKNPAKHVPGKDVIIGDNCWIGMNSVIMPGVVLGPNTTVGAGSIVTKSFPEGYCVIAGNPAQKIKSIEVEQYE